MNYLCDVGEDIPYCLNLRFGREKADFLSEEIEWIGPMPIRLASGEKPENGNSYHFSFRDENWEIILKEDCVYLTRK
jgi:hypothetical protein